MYLDDTMSRLPADASGDEVVLRYCWRAQKAFETHLAPSGTTSSPDVETLHHHLHNLPQELYDMIFDLTFLPPSGTKISLNTSHKPPSTLQVSRSTRSAALKAYYESNIFEPTDATMIWRFTNALPKEVREGVRRQVERSWEETVRGRWKGRWPPDPAFAFAWDFA